jgi:hypothetical protein
MIDLNDEWLDNKIEEIKGMQIEIEKRLEQLKQQQLMNLGAITMLNQIKNGVVEQTATKKNGNNSE